MILIANITRHMDTGKSRLDATLLGAREVGFTVLSMTGGSGQISRNTVA
jgi:multidrug efflux pump